MAISVGIDVSWWQGAIDWAAVGRATNPIYRFGICRMTRAGQGIDDTGRRNLRGILDHLPVAGGYGVVGTRDPAADARLLVQEIAAVTDPAGVLVMLDAERFQDGTGPSRRQIDIFARQVHALLGRWPVAYVPDWYLDWLASKGDGDGTVRGLELANCLWVPSEYIDPPWTETRISSKRPTNLRGFAGLAWHQFTSSGSVPGITGRVDLNAYYGTLSELRSQLLGQEDLMLEQTDKDWFIRQFTAGEDGVTLRTAIWQLVVRAVNSALGSGTSRAAIDLVAIGDGSPARQGVADVVGGLPVELDVTQLTPDQLAMVAEVFAGKVVITGVQAKAGQFTVTFEPAA